MKNKIYFSIIFLLLQTSVKSQYVEKVTGLNYNGNNGLNPRNLTIFNDKIYFLGTDEKVYVDKLMVTDGTEAGVKVIRQIDSGKLYPSIKHLTVLNNMLLFNNSDGLWKSDGTTPGTSSIAKITIDYNNSFRSYAILNNKVYFGADKIKANPLKDQLWCSDGTPGGTVLVKTINPNGSSNVRNLFVDNGKLFFWAHDGTTAGLWVSNGAGAGTFNIPGVTSPSDFFSFNGKVYFNGTDASGSRIWETDGTIPGTKKVTDVNGGNSPGTFTVFKGKIYFRSYELSSFSQLWVTDGTDTGTHKFKTDYTIRNGERGFYPASMAVHNNKLYFSGYDSLTMTYQLWVSDGTTKGTVKVTNFPYPKGFNPERLFSYQSRLVMLGYDSVTTYKQIFAYNDATNTIYRPAPPLAQSSSPFYPFEEFTAFHNALYYTAAYGYFADYQLCRYSEHPAAIKKDDRTRLSIYPNPTKGIINLELGIKNQGEIKIQIFNSVGKLALEETSSIKDPTLNIQDLQNGLYFVKVIMDSQIIAWQSIIKSDF